MTGHVQANFRCNRLTLNDQVDAKVFLTLKRLECVNEDLEGQFHREHHAPSNHVKLFTKDQIQRIKNIIDSLSLILKRNEFYIEWTVSH